MAEILNFESDKKTLSLPNEKIEVIAFNEIAETYSEDEMVDIKHWNGECWKAFYEHMVVPMAEKLEVDTWDYMATCIGVLFNGLRFEKLENGDTQMVIGREE